MVKRVSNPVVPAVTTTGITDDATRNALQTLSSGWEVRNGQTPQRFITMAELKSSAPALVANGFSALFQGGGSGVFPGDVKSVVDAIQHSVMQSLLWQDLGERITFLTAENNRSLKRIQEMEVTAGDQWEEIKGVKIAIDNNWAAWLLEKELLISQNEAISTAVSTLSVQVGGNTSTIQNFQTAQTNWNSSMAQQYSQLQTSLGQNQQAILQEAQARQTADGVMEAKYTVKIDQNGYVTGYGLMSTANNATPYSEFIVRADRFAIGSPSGPGIPPGNPFTVLTTTDANGTPPGVYMDSAFIKYASIAGAHIKNLEVGTLKLKDGAVTTQAYLSKHGVIATGNGSTQIVGEIRINMPFAGWLFAFSTGYIAYQSGWTHVETNLAIDGQKFSGGGGGSAWVNAAHSCGTQVNDGIHVITLDFTAGPRAQIGNIGLFVIGGFK
jgi:hypothetical protein